MACCVPETAMAQQRSFDIPSQPANRALPTFARQAGIQIVAPGRSLRSIRTKAIRGQLDIRAALRAMLEGTGVRIVADSNNSITLGLDPTPPRVAARPRPRSAERPAPRMQRAATDAELARDLAPRLAPLPDIFVTGSRLRTDGYDSPVPLTVIDASLMQELGHGNASDAVRLIPQNVATQSDASSGNKIDGNIGAFYANLRGLNPSFGTRTLTLVNGRRFIPTSDGGAVDLNLIPSVMIARIETVTGGASAAYGSDAVAGVVNIVLDDRLTGFRAQADHGRTSRADGQTFHVGAAFGTGFAGGRGRLVLGGEYQDQRGIGHCAPERAWCAESWDVYTNANAIQPGTLNNAANASGYNVPGSAGYGQPNFIVGPNSRVAYNTPYGVVRNLVAAATSTTLAINPPLAAVDKRFTADATGIVDFDPGRYLPKGVSGQRQGGDGVSTYADPLIQTPVERHATYLSASFEASDALTLFTELSYSRRKSRSVSFAAAARSNFAVKATNAFLPASLVTLLDGANFSLGKDVDAEVGNDNIADARIFRGVIGARGALLPGWSWDFYYQYGENRRHSQLTRSRHNQAFIYALDAVRNAAGQIVCAETLKADPDPVAIGCAPMNLFGLGNLSEAATDYVWRPVDEHFKYRQHALSASVQGALAADRNAGPISVAAGIDYRAEKGEVTHDGINANDFAFSFGLDYGGAINVTEGFVETNVPIFRDSSLGKLFELNGALRYTRNVSSDTGPGGTGASKSIEATSWKLGSIFDPVDGLRIRATMSRDIRAAGFRELFLKNAPTDPTTVQGRVLNPNIPGLDKTDATPVFSGGSFALKPERADTITAGLVISPPFIPGLRLSADWYQIRLKDAISSLTAQRIVDLCSGSQILCDRISFAMPQDIVRIDAYQVNSASIDVRGFDFEVFYRLPLDRLSGRVKGNLDLRLLANHQYDLVAQQSLLVPPLDYAGQSGPVIDGGDFNPMPKWMWQGIFAYDNGPFNTTLTVRHVGKAALNREWIGPDDPRYDPTGPDSVNINRVPSATYVGLAMSHAISLGEADRHVEIFGAIDNLFDVKPPVAPGGGANGLLSAYPTSPVFFDTFGMRFRGGIRVRL
jgi:iron complex outermembrane receptor protein